MRQRLRAMVLAGCAAICPQSARAESTGAQFLNIPVNPRALGLGSGIVALSDDVGSITNNPAGLGRLRGRDLNLLYAPHLQGMDVGFLAYAHPMAYGSVGASYLTLRSGAIDGRDDAGNPAASFAAEDSAVALSFGRAVLDSDDDPAGRLRLGANLKFVTSRIASYSASTFALDFGAQFPFTVGPVPLALGGVLRNIGPGMKFMDRSYPLPSNAVIGAAVQPFGAMVVSAGVSRSFADQKTEFSIGTEFSPTSMVAVRGSYGMTQIQSAGGAPLPSLSGGIGIKWSSCRLDYAFAPVGGLGTTQRLSLTIRFKSFGFGSSSSARNRAGDWSAVDKDPQVPPSGEIKSDAWQWSWRQAWVY